MLPDSQGACPLDEFGDIAVLSGEQPEPGHGIPTAEALLKQAKEDLVTIRWFIVQDLAAGFDCTKPLQAWNKERPATGLPAASSKPLYIHVWTWKWEQYLMRWHT